jgi:hypothetical protein
VKEDLLLSPTLLVASDQENIDNDWHSADTKKQPLSIGFYFILSLSTIISTKSPRAA